MKKLLLLCVCLLGTAGYCSAQETPLDLWDVAYLQGARAGYVHTYTQEMDNKGEKILRTTVELRLSMKRNNTLIQLGMDSGTVETALGKVVGVYMKQYLGKNQTLHIAGNVTGDELRLTHNGKPIKPAPWNDEVVGIHRQQALFKEKQLKPGDEFSFLTFEPSVNLVLRAAVQAKDFEEVELFGGRTKKRLLRVETTPEKIQNVQLPALVQWLGPRLTPERSEVEIPGLGTVTLYRASKQEALSPNAVAGLTDVGLSQLVRLRQRIVSPFSTTLAHYRITIKGEQDAADTFSRDKRQKVSKLKGDTFELLVSGKVRGEKADAAGAEFTQSSYFINCDDAVVKDLAKKAVRGEKEPWQKALKIEKWVHDHMSFQNHEALATADTVARTLQGDCTEFAMLMAAMCRAEGVPSRTAVGLVYGEVKGAPIFGFHMWTEVFVEGTWVPLDATLGLGRVAATHLKIADQSWHETRNLTPLLPVVRVLGRISIEVLGVNREDS